MANLPPKGWTRVSKERGEKLWDQSMIVSFMNLDGVLLSMGHHIFSSGKIEQAFVALAQYHRSPEDVENSGTILDLYMPDVTGILLVRVDFRNYEQGVLVQAHPP